MEKIFALAIYNDYEPFGCDFTEMPNDNRGIFFKKFNPEYFKELVEYDYVIYDLEYPEEGVSYAGTFNNALLDPIFWQTLGRALGWSIYAVCQIHGKECELNCIRAYPQEWLYHWHRFIDHLADGKSRDSFFEELIK